MTVRFVLNHPFNRGRKIKALFNLFKWQFFSRVYRLPVIYQFTQNSKLIVWKGLNGATGNLYCGLHEFEDMAFLLHLLRPGDLFMDIGANIGSYTILASAEIGADTIAVEPIPSTFDNLKQNILVNDIADKVTALNIGLGSKPDMLRFTSSLDTGNHVSIGEADSILVNVNILDNVAENKIPVLMKVDVEGFESEVLKGANNTLQSPLLKAIIIELNGSGETYGFKDADIHTTLTGYGFRVMKYDPAKRQLFETSVGREHNTRYVRDLEFVNDRLLTARPVLVQGIAV